MRDFTHNSARYSIYTYMYMYIRRGCFLETCVHDDCKYLRASTNCGRCEAPVCGNRRAVTTNYLSAAAAVTAAAVVGSRVTAADVLAGLLASRFRSVLAVYRARNVSPLSPCETHYAFVAFHMTRLFILMVRGTKNFTFPRVYAKTGKEARTIAGV